MPEIKIYTTRFCPYCIHAKRLLNGRDLRFNEVPVDGKPGLRAEMTRLAGGQTSVPQIWIGDTHIGGCTDLMALESSGQLDALLAG